eukprot:9492469-Pyramimonas_sp.AAC.1
MNADMLEFTIGTDPAWEWAKEHKKFVAMKNARAQLKAKAGPGTLLKELLTTKMQDVKTKYGDAYFTEQIQKIPIHHQWPHRQAAGLPRQAEQHPRVERQR